MNVELFFQILTLTGSAGFLAAVYYAFKLSGETKHERYWLVLAIAATFLAINSWAKLPWEFHIITSDVREWIEQISGMLGAVLLGYSVYGLARSIRMVREKTE